MTPARWALAIFGMLFGGGIVGAVALDCWLEATGRETISKYIEMASKVDPIVAVLIASPFFFVVGCLCGHFWFPQSQAPFPN